MFDQLQQRQTEGPTTFAEPEDAAPFSARLYRALPLPIPGTSFAVPRDVIENTETYANIFTTAERQQRLVNNAFSAERSAEEAYDQRIAAIKDATGIELENPLRGGYAMDARKQIRDEIRANSMQSIDAKGGVPEYQRRIFDAKVAEVQQKHPDLLLPTTEEAAKDIARTAEFEANAATQGANPIGSFVAGMAGGLWAGRRDPLFVGSLFAGPVGATGKTVLARIVDSGIRQGLFNAGIAALEQPTVQAWRKEVGVRSGLEPAVENVGLAFLFGFIPGAAFRGVHEAVTAAPAVQRVLAGAPQPGDLEIAARAVREALQPHEAAAVRMGEEMTDADKALLPPPPRDVGPELHDDLTAAALRQADDPLNSPAPEAVAALKQVEPDPDIAARIQTEQPRDLAEAQMVATEVLEERASKATVTQIQEDFARPPLPESMIDEAAPKLPAKDPLSKIPFVRDDGTPTMISQAQAAKIGERESTWAMLVRSCK